VQDKFLQFLGLIKKSGKLIEGYNKCEDSIKKNILFLLILSVDCSTNTKDKFFKYCDTYNVPFIYAYTKEELGLPLGRDEISVLGITDENMSKKLLSLRNENNNINPGGECIVKNTSI
jgi:ribosomal protein L7Ae-like RNA K-turn-binding protein